MRKLRVKEVKEVTGLVVGTANTALQSPTGVLFPVELRRQCFWLLHTASLLAASQATQLSKRPMLSPVNAGGSRRVTTSDSGPRGTQKLPPYPSLSLYLSHQTLTPLPTPKVSVHHTMFPRPSRDCLARAITLYKTGLRKKTF